MPPGYFGSVFIGAALLLVSLCAGFQTSLGYMQDPVLLPEEEPEVDGVEELDGPEGGATAEGAGAEGAGAEEPAEGATT